MMMLQPTALFKAVFWDRFTSRSLVYAPWGNGEEANATIVTNRVGFSSPSRSFAYYGSSPVKFYIKNVGLLLKTVLLPKRT